MNPGKFTELCLRTARVLELSEPEAFAENQVVAIDGVEVQFIQDAHHGHRARLFMELGDTGSVDKLEVYENLFAVQLLIEGVVDGQFVLDNLHDRILFIARLPLSADTQPDQLAMVIRSFVLQVKEWRTTIMTGDLFDEESSDIVQRGRFDSGIARVQTASREATYA